MKQRPTLHTTRLVLRPFALTDASEVQRLAGDKAIADTTANIPHPYLDGLAEQWIARHQERFEAGKLIPLAVTQQGTGALIGAVSLMDIIKNDKTNSDKLMPWRRMLREGRGCSIPFVYAE